MLRRREDELHRRALLLGAKGDRGAAAVEPDELPLVADDLVLMEAHGAARQGHRLLLAAADPHMGGPVLVDIM